MAPAPPGGRLAGAGPVLAHEGSNTLWHAIVVLSPGAGVGAFALSNDGGRGPRATRALVEGLLLVA